MNRYAREPHRSEHYALSRAAGSFVRLANDNWPGWPEQTTEPSFRGWRRMKACRRIPAPEGE
ncbi:MAG TPA: hypothetical protein VEF89_14660 [Solirubrobacteraceae bacterium]|nr:hypothetical protein [Solirubrobacteraceae bacterium]